MFKALIFDQMALTQSYLKSERDNPIRPTITIISKNLNPFFLLQKYSFAEFSFFALLIQFKIVILRRKEEAQRK